MMSFCKKTVHSFLGLTIPINYAPNPTNNNNTFLQDKPSKCLNGLGLITATVSSKTPNILESAAVKSSSSCLQAMKKDPGGIGFVDDVGGGVNGLMSCTESLGFESCDERRADEKMGELLSTRSDEVKWRKIGGRSREVKKKFPPPISSLNHNGQPSFFLRPLRKDGRLELTEVRIDRPEILRAHRQDGRLRLHLITDEDEDEDDITNQEKQDEEEEIEKEENEEWRFPVSGDGFRRCNEVATHHHHNLHVWRQHCVTTS